MKNRRRVQKVILFHDILYPARIIEIIRAGYSVKQRYSNSVSLSDNCFEIFWR